MVRTLKDKAVRSLKKDESAILLPGATQAEPWELWLLSPREPVQCLQVYPSPLDNPLSRSTTLALPVAQVYCLPLWLNETEPKEFEGMIALQLELRGLKPRGDEPAVFDWTVVTQEGARTLVTVGVLPAALPDEIQSGAYDLFDLSARCLPLQPNTLTLWMEQDRLVFAVTHGQHLLYFQALAEQRISDSVVQDLTCAVAALASQGVLAPLQGVMLWMEITPAETKAIERAMQLPVRTAEPPAPDAPTVSWKLRPTTVVAAQRVREARRWQWRGFLVALAVYLLVIGWFVAQYFLLSGKVTDLRQWQAQHAKTLAMISETRGTWKDLQPVVDETNYPLELLFHTAEAIPENQLHLTLFETSDGRVRIRAEAKDFGAASKFEESLKSNPHFSAYSWDMGQPRLLPNDLAQLQIIGTRESTNQE